MRGTLIASLALSFHYAGAHPLSLTSNSHLTKRIVDLTTFKSKVATNYTDSASVKSDSRLSINSRASPQDTATELVKKTVPGATFRLVESYIGTNGVTHVYFKQTANDLDIDNGDFNVNVSLSSVDVSRDWSDIA
jgi:extracellular elastinolytic metalloproteinase